MAGILGIVGSPLASDIFPQMLRFAQLYPWYETRFSRHNLATCGLKDLGECAVRGDFTLLLYGEIFKMPTPAADNSITLNIQTAVNADAPEIHAQAPCVQEPAVNADTPEIHAQAPCVQEPAVNADAPEIHAQELRVQEPAVNADTPVQQSVPNSCVQNVSLKDGSAPITVAERLLDGLLTYGKEFLANVEGRFQGVLWDSRNQVLSIFCDQFATRPLYWTQTADGFLFAPQLKTLLQCPAVSRKINREALVDFFTWGHYLHTHTSIEGIEVLPPSGFFTWDRQTGQVTRTRYASFPVGGPASTVDEVAEAFRMSVRQQGEKYTLNENGMTGFGISLSGGLDARSILGLLPSEIQEKMKSVALGVPGSADHLLAAQLAKCVGTQHFNYELNPNFLQKYENSLTEMVRLTDGQYLSSSIVIPTLDFYREIQIRTLFRGHAGELFHMSKAYAFSMTEEERKTMAEGRLSPKIWAFQHLQAYMLDGVNSDLLLGIPRSECTRIARDSLYRAIDETGEEREGAIWHLYLAQRVFREIPLSMRKFDSHVNVRLPFLSRGIADAILRLPTKYRMGETIQHQILKRWRPDFLKVRNVNTGTFIGAWPIVQKAAHLHQRILAKLNVPGTQPYEKMGLWLRSDLKPLVRRLLLEDGGLSGRGIIHPDTIREVVRAHNEGKNHTYLILALLIMEKQIRFLEL
ncbi:MAG: hypothetical protein IJD43_14825 [Thermoguttaceae bacterium]|nr:hypothetical protein [Thermoguttaceae bacterium]